LSIYRTNRRTVTRPERHALISMFAATLANTDTKNKKKNNQCSSLYTVRHKNTSKFIDSNLKTDDKILIIFGINIPNTTGNQMTIYVCVTLNVCFCTTWGSQTSKILHLYSMQYHYLIKTTRIWHILSKFLPLWLTVYLIAQLCNC